MDFEVYEKGICRRHQQMPTDSTQIKELSSKRFVSLCKSLFK